LKQKILKYTRRLLGILFVGTGIYLAQYDAIYIYESNGISANTHEVYDKNLAYIQDLKTAENYIDSQYFTQNKFFDSFLFLQVTNDFVKKKFYHGNAAFDWKENWIAYLLGKYLWSHFNSLVSPNEVIKHCSAMCSQQTMVYTRILELKGFTYRYVYLKYDNKGHFCCEIWNNNEWHFVDVNQEPNWGNINGLPNQNIESLIKTGKLELIYKSSDEFMHNIRSKNASVTYSKISEKIGANMMLFQFLTKYISWILPVLIGLYLIFSKIIFKKEVV
jgi:hypothetical protein